MKILYKLLIAFLFASLLVSVVGFYGMNSALSIGAKYDEIEEETIPVIETLEEMRFSGLRIVTSTFEYYSMVSENKTGELEGVEKSLIMAEIEHFDISFNKYETIINRFFPEEKEFLDKLRVSSEKLKRTSSDLIDLKEKGISGDQVVERFEEFEDAELDFMNIVDKALEHEIGESKEKSGEISSLIADSGKKISILSFSTIFLAVALGIIVSISISGPIDKLKSASEEIIKGKLGTRVDIRSDDETGILGNAFNRMVNQLSHEITEHKKAEKQLRQKNDFVNNVIESLSHPFYVINVDDYSIALSNSAACEKGSTQPSTCYALMHKNDKPCSDQGDVCPLEIVKNTGKPVVAEHVHYDKDGNARTLEIHCYPIFNSNRDVVQVIEYSLDITQRKESEKALFESESKFRTLFDNVTDGILLADVKTRKQYMANKKICEMLGYSHEEILNLSVSDLHPEKDLPWIMDVFEKQAKGEISLIENIPVKRKDGTIFYADINTNPLVIAGKIYNIGIFRDITERKKAETKLKDSEERFRSVSLYANDAIITSDSSGKIIFWNLAAQKILGYESSEILGKPITILMHEKIRENHNKVMERFRITNEPHIIGKTVELQAIRKDGREIPVEITLSTWKIEENTFISAILRDISERKRNEVIRLENERLVLANQAQSEFLSIMSHELRTPLNAIIGFSELLEKKGAGDLNEKQQRYAENINSSGKHLLNLIDDILDLTRIESGKMEMIIEKMSVMDVVNKVVDAFKEAASNHNIIIRTEISPDLEFIETEPRKFRQVLDNLLDNAMKFSKPEGGTVTITAEIEGEMGKFSVSDTGIGIKDEDMGRIFKDFEQLDSGISRKYGGTGLGLVISKKLIEILGGRITVESKYGEGSKFTLYLSLVPENVVK